MATTPTSQGAKELLEAIGKRVTKGMELHAYKVQVCGQLFRRDDILHAIDSLEVFFEGNSIIITSFHSWATALGPGASCSVASITHNDAWASSTIIGFITYYIKYRNIALFRAKIYYKFMS